MVIFVFSASKSNIFFVFADGCSFFSAPSRRDSCMFIHIYLLVLTKNPQKCHLLSARARVVFRNEHFFSPQGVAQLSACRRISVLISGIFLPRGRIFPCLFPHVFLFEVWKVLPPGKQKETRTARWLTRLALSCARDALPAYRCQAKAVFC